LLHIVQSKGNKDRYVPLSAHLIRGIKKYISIEHPKNYLFEGSGNPEGKGFDGRYSQRGVQWAVKAVAKQAGILKEVHTHMMRHSYATHLLEDGVNIIAVQKLLGHQKQKPITRPYPHRRLNQRHTQNMRHWQNW